MDQRRSVVHLDQLEERRIKSTNISLHVMRQARNLTGSTRAKGCVYKSNYSNTTKPIQQLGEHAIHQILLDGQQAKNPKQTNKKTILLT